MSHIVEIHNQLVKAGYNIQPAGYNANLDLWEFIATNGPIYISFYSEDETMITVTADNKKPLKRLFGNIDHALDFASKLLQTSSI